MSNSIIRFMLGTFISTLATRPQTNIWVLVPLSAATGTADLDSEGNVHGKSGRAENAPPWYMVGTAV